MDVIEFSKNEQPSQAKILDVDQRAFRTFFRSKYGANEFEGACSIAVEVNETFIKLIITGGKTDTQILDKSLKLGVDVNTEGKVRPVRHGLYVTPLKNSRAFHGCTKVKQRYSLY